MDEIKRMQQLAGIREEDNEWDLGDLGPEWNEIEVSSFDVFYLQITEYEDDNGKIGLFAHYGGIDGIGIEPEYLGTDDDDNDEYDTNNIVTTNNLSNLYDHIDNDDDLLDSIINSYDTGEWVYKEEGFDKSNANTQNDQYWYTITSFKDKNGKRYNVVNENDYIDKIVKQEVSNLK